jgi:hypothetical protein
MDHKSLYAWVGGWCLTGPAKKTPVFFSPPEGARYLNNTDQNWAVIKDRKNPSAIQLFSISLASFVRMLVTASTFFVEICCCARVCGHKHLPAALASMPAPFWRLRATEVSFLSFENA